MRIVARAHRAIIAAVLLLAACSSSGRIDTGSAIALPSGGSVHLSVDSTPGAASPEQASAIVPHLRERITQELLSQNVFSKVSLDASPTDIIVHVAIVGIAGWEGPDEGPASLIREPAEVRTEVEVVDASNARMLGRFSASGTSAAMVFGGRKDDALDTVAREIARFLASG